ncbi:MAG: hypothetical protein QGH83_06850 [Candidatus Pacebacteria bacterium]|nr:hypothetical protein [Candidatus Paceibacterota bacterium]
MVSTVKVTNIDTPDNTGNITFDRPIAGDGSNLTGVAPTKATVEALGIDVPAANLTGSIAGARLPDPLPAISGASLTSLSAANITSGGTLPALNGSSLTNLPATQMHICQINHDLTLLSGTDSYDQCPFQPDYAFCFAADSAYNATGDAMSWAMGDDTTMHQLVHMHGSQHEGYTAGGFAYWWMSTSNRVAFWWSGAGNGFTSDGFNYEWARVGTTASGNFMLNFMLIKL